MSYISIKASDIDNWTSKEPRRAQELLPKLVWKLILASSKKIEDHHFPFEKAIQYNGYDGYLVTSDNNSFYPQGVSVWEFGTDQNIKGKFDSDYNKRSESPQGIDVSSTTFCFVTSRIWNHREGIVEFTSKKQADNLWKNVRIIDANNLEIWLSECPTVSVWFAEILGVSQKDILDLESYWHSIVNKTRPRLTEEFFCYGRDKLISKQINQMISEKKSPIILSADSKIEGILTLAAELINSQEIEHKQLLSKIIVVTSSEGVTNAYHNYDDAIIIPAFENEKHQININGFAIIPTEKNGPIDMLYKNASRCALDGRRKRDFSKALEMIGYDTNEANKIAIDVKCRFSPLLRKITEDVNLKVPLWINDNINNLIPALLANSWESSLDGDKEVIEILSGKKYNDYIESIELFLHGDNAPVFNLDGFFACISTNELWDVLAQHFTRPIFDNYKRCISYVFSEKNPKYELPEDKWEVSSLYGKNSKFSERIKKGLILSMTKIVELGETQGLFTFCTDCTNECNKLVREIYNQVNTKEQWYTLSSYLSDFVEAVPDSIIDIIEKNCNDNGSLFWTLFEKLDCSIFGRNYYTDILWALEKLAWLNAYATRAIYALVAISEKKYEYKISNSPIDSLYKIFCLWHPQGSLSLDDRMLILNKIINEYHYTGRLLVDHLLPSRTNTVTSLAEFRWRHYEHSCHSVTNQDYFKSITGIANCFVQTISSCYNDWRIVIDNFSVFINAFEELKINMIEICSEMSDDEKLKFCKEIAYEIGRHRKFANSEWSLNEETLTKMEKLYQSMLPDSPLRYAHYYSYKFDGLTPHVYDRNNYDYEAETEEVQKIRTKALEEVIDQYGMESIFLLTPKVDEITLLVESLVSSKFFNKIDIDFIVQAHSRIPEFVERLINSIYYVEGISFFSSLVINDDKIDFIICQLPLKPDVLDFIEKLSTKIQNAFWENVSAWRVAHEDYDFTKKCFKNLLKVNRPYSVIRELYFSKVVDSNIILEALHKGLELYPNTEKTGISLNSISTDNLEKLFSRLHADSSADTTIISQLEFAYLPIFNIDFEPTCLVNSVLTNPPMFLELITYAYKKDSDDEAFDENKKNLAKKSYSALQKVKKLPGQIKNDINIEVFNSWIDTVKKLSTEMEYQTACDLEIGRILSYSPLGDDGIWPHKCVRDFLEKNVSKTVENNFAIGLFNQRGVHNVTGGDEEEQLANKYYEYAKKLQVLYPKTSQILNRIGDNYKSDSKYERNRELKGYF